jgi:hypothetical protein
VEDFVPEGAKLFCLMLFEGADEKPLFDLAHKFLLVTHKSASSFVFFGKEANLKGQVHFEEFILFGPNMLFGIQEGLDGKEDKK